MNCTEFKTAVEWILDTHGSLDAPAREHISTCQSCCTQWEIERQLDAVIDVWQAGAGVDALNDLSPKHVTALMETLRNGAPQVSLCESVLHELKIPVSDEMVRVPVELEWINNRRAESQTRPCGVGSPEKFAAGNPRAGGIAVLAAAASLLFAVLFTGQQSGPEVSQLSSSTLTDMKSHPMTEPAVELEAPDVSETLTAVLWDLRSEYQEMATETTSAARDLVNAIPVTAIPLTLNVSDRVTPEEFELRPPSVDAARIWRPISTRVETALGFLWTAVPSQVPAG